jgi:hypothetical protein
MSSATARANRARRGFRFHPRLWIAAGLLLALPAVAMQFTSEVDWSAEDFAVFAVMLAGLCGGIEAALNWLTAPRWRIGAVMLGVLLFLTVWVHLAVGWI